MTFEVGKEIETLEKRALVRNFQKNELNFFLFKKGSQPRLCLKRVKAKCGIM